MTELFKKFMVFAVILSLCLTLAGAGAQDGKARGTVTFTRSQRLRHDGDDHGDDHVKVKKKLIVILKGVLLRSKSGVFFKTTKLAAIPPGKDSVDVPAEAVDAGPRGNVEANQINRWLLPIPGMGSVTNHSAFTGGSAVAGGIPGRSKEIKTPEAPTPPEAPILIDLSISSDDIVFRPKPLMVKEPAEIHFKVHNIGNKAVLPESFKFIFYRPAKDMRKDTDIRRDKYHKDDWEKWKAPPPRKLEDVPPRKGEEAIHPGRSETFLLEWTPQVVTNYTFMIEIELAPALRDTDPSNNRAISETVEAKGTVKLSLSYIETAGSCTQYSVLTVSGKVHNSGTVSSADTKVSLYVDDEFVNESDLGYVNSGVSEPFSFEWVCSSLGSHSIKCVVTATEGESAEHELDVTVGEASEPDRVMEICENTINVRKVKNTDDTIAEVFFQVELQSLIGHIIPRDLYFVEVTVDPDDEARSEFLGRFDGIAIPSASRVDFPSEEVRWIPTAGYHNVRFTVKPTVGTEGEFSVTEQFNITTVPSLLSIFSISVINPEVFPPGDPAEIRAVIHNIGTRASLEGEWKIRRIKPLPASSYFAYDEFSSIEAGGSFSIEIELNTDGLRMGENELEFKVSADENAPSPTATFQLIRSIAPSVLSVESSEISPSEVTMGKPFVISITLRNAGDHPTEEGTWAIDANFPSSRALANGELPVIETEGLHPISAEIDTNLLTVGYNYMVFKTDIPTGDASPIEEGFEVTILEESKDTDDGDSGKLPDQAPVEGTPVYVYDPRPVIQIMAAGYRRLENVYNHLDSMDPVQGALQEQYQKFISNLPNFLHAFQSMIGGVHAILEPADAYDACAKLKEAADKALNDAFDFFLEVDMRVGLRNRLDNIWWYKGPTHTRLENVFYTIKGAMDTLYNKASDPGSPEFHQALVEAYNDLNYFIAASENLRQTTTTAIGAGWQPPTVYEEGEVRAQIALDSYVDLCKNQALRDKVALIAIFEQIKHPIQAPYTKVEVTLEKVVIWNDRDGVLKGQGEINLSFKVGDKSYTPSEFTIDWNPPLTGENTGKAKNLNKSFILTVSHHDPLVIEATGFERDIWPDKKDTLGSFTSFHDVDVELSPNVSIDPNYTRRSASESDDLSDFFEGKDGFTLYYNIRKM